MTPLRGKAREGEESPDALKGASYQPPRFRRTITPVVYAPSRGVQLGRIAVSLKLLQPLYCRRPREGEESPDALKGASYQPPRFRRTITPVVYAPSRGVQLGRIAVSLWLLQPLYGRRPREGEESPDALKGASYQPPRFRRTITPVVYAPSRGVQLGRIA